MDLFHRIVANIRQPAADANETRIRRRRKVISLLVSRLTKIRIVFLVAGFLWMLLLPSPRLSRGTYIDENALQPGQVTTYFGWADVHRADSYLAELEGLRDRNATSEERGLFLREEFRKFGLPASTQGYHFSASTGNVDGTNAYAILASPRTSGAEAIVISASWLSRTGEGDGTLNLRGVASVLALANFLKQYSLWAKDIIFIVSDGYLHGMHAWLNAYHGIGQQNLQSDPLELSSGVIWTALNLDYPGHSFSHLGVFYEGLNGRLPNQDLMNSFERISGYAGVPVVLYDHAESQEIPSTQSWVQSLVSSLPNGVRDTLDIKTLLSQARNVARHIGYQARGRPSGVHGLFHQYRIDAITLYGLPSMGPHGFHAIGRVVESTLRTKNNLLERLHASFFFYILTSPTKFLKIGSYLPSAILISVAMMFGGLSIWSNAGWVRGGNATMDAGAPPINWTRRRRPTLPIVGFMTFTHILGTLLFYTITSPWFIHNYTSLAPSLFVAIAVFAPLLMIAFPVTDGPANVATRSTLLKSLNLCLASTIVSITSVLNFSLAASLAVCLSVPLSVSSPSPKPLNRVVKYFMYVLLAVGWLLLGQREVTLALRDWECFGGWFAPVVCIVYVPLVFQAAVVCLLPH